MAVGLAPIFATGHKNIDDSLLESMRTHVSDHEIVELALMSLMWAGGAFGNILGIRPQELLGR